MGIRCLAVLGLAGLLTACNSDTVVAPPDFRVLVTTDAARYSLSSGVVHTTLGNLSSKPIYMWGCAPNLFLDHQENGEWKELGAFWYAVCMSAPDRPYPIEPDAWVTLPPLDLRFDYSRVLEPGTYRMRALAFADDQRPNTLLPEDQLVSKPFQIVK
jgi:hypothetical protein